MGLLAKHRTPGLYIEHQGTSLFKSVLYRENVDCSVVVCAALRLSI